MTDHLDAMVTAMHLLNKALGPQAKAPATTYCETLAPRSSRIESYHLWCTPVPSPGRWVQYRSIDDARVTAPSEGLVCFACDGEIVPGLCVDPPDDCKDVLIEGCSMRLDECVCEENAEVARSVRVCHEGSSSYVA